MKQSAGETIRLLSQKTEELKKLDAKLKVVCIAENWCGDCGNGVPVISMLAEQVPQWDYRIASRDEFEHLVEEFYTTAGRKKIPIVLFADEDGDEIIRWVERPRNSYEALAELQAKRLPKEEYIREYKHNPDINVPGVCSFILDELIDHGAKAAAMVKILPRKS
jgi:hypothetical protein